MADDREVRLDAFLPDEIQELLQELGVEVTPEQALLLVHLVTQCGGLDEARDTLERMQTQRAA